MTFWANNLWWLLVDFLYCSSESFRVKYCSVLTIYNDSIKCRVKIYDVCALCNCFESLAHCWRLIILLFKT